MCVSQSSWSEKSSQENRKSEQSLPLKCLHHMGCSSQAASGNIVKIHGGGVILNKSYIQIVSHTFLRGGGVNKSLCWNILMVFGN